MITSIYLTQVCLQRIVLLDFYAHELSAETRKDIVLIFLLRGSASLVMSKHVSVVCLCVCLLDQPFQSVDQFVD